MPQFLPDIQNAEQCDIPVQHDPFRDLSERIRAEGERAAERIALLEDALRSVCVNATRAAEPCFVGDVRDTMSALAFISRMAINGTNAAEAIAIWEKEHA